jgi:hypothetical protein
VELFAFLTAEDLMPVVVFVAIVTGVFWLLSAISVRNSQAEERLERIGRPKSLVEIEMAQAETKGRFTGLKEAFGNLGGATSLVAVYSFETNEYEKLTEFGQSPMWFPDSIRFVFYFHDKAYIGDLKTKRVREVFKSEEDEIRSANISSDGQLLYFTILSSESDIWLLDLE